MRTTRPRRIRATRSSRDCDMNRRAPCEHAPAETAALQGLLRVALAACNTHESRRAVRRAYGERLAPDRAARELRGAVAGSGYVDLHAIIHAYARVHARAICTQAGASTGSYIHISALGARLIRDLGGAPLVQVHRFDAHEQGDQPAVGRHAWTGLRACAKVSRCRGCLMRTIAI